MSSRHPDVSTELRKILTKPRLEQAQTHEPTLLSITKRFFVLTHKTLLQVFLTTVHILLLLTQTKAYIKILLLVLVMKQTNSKALLQLESSVPPQWPWPRGRGCYGAVTALCFTVPLQNSTCSWKSKKFIKYDFAIPEMRYEQPVKLDLFIWGIPWTKLLISCNGRMLRGWKRP